MVSQEQRANFKSRLEDLKKAQLNFQAEFRQAKAIAEQLRETIAHTQRHEERVEKSRLLAKLEKQIQDMEPQIAKRERLIQDMEQALSSL